MLQLQCVSRRCCGAARERGETRLGFDVVGDVVDGASQGDLSDRPRGVVGQIGGQDADPQLALWENKQAYKYSKLQSKEKQDAK